MKRWIYRMLMLGMMMWLNGAALMAQCSTCKSAAATRDSDGDFLFGGINTGILYLLALPIFLPMIFGVVWYVVSRAKPKEEMGQ